MQWQQREATGIESLVGMDEVVAQFLATRGFVDATSAQKFLSFGLKDMKDPLTLDGMSVALERLTLAYKQQDPICIYGDFDMDGTPALALMYRGLKGLGYQNIFYCQPDRHTDGYGFHFHLAQKMIDQHGIKVFITVDVGITDIETVAILQELGVDVVLTDHHQVLEKKPQALAVINPNQPDCTAGMGYLCGTGVAFYLIMGLRRHLKEQGLLLADFDIKNILDCFAIGTIADLVPLVNENRVLTKHGLKVLEKTSMVGIRLLLEALKLNEKTLGAQDVAIRFVPKLNSLTRLDLELKPIDLFLVEDPAKAALMVQTVLKNNEHRVALLEESEALLDSMVSQKSHHHKDRPDVLFFWSEHFHKGLVGLLATHLVGNFNRPAFVGTLTKKGVIVGSARAPEGSSLSVVKALQGSQEHLNKFGGHPAAAGFELNPENADAFTQALAKNLAEQTNVQVQKKYDLPLDFSEIHKFMKWWDQLEPFGQQFAAPIFKVEKLQIQKITVLKKTHLKVAFQDARGFLMDSLWFFPQDIDFFQGKEDKKFVMICEPQWNEFMGNRRIQLLLRDIQEQT